MIFLLMCDDFAHEKPPAIEYNSYFGEYQIGVKVKNNLTPNLVKRITEHIKPGKYPNLPQTLHFIKVDNDDEIYKYIPDSPPELYTVYKGKYQAVKHQGHKITLSIIPKS